MSDEHLIVGAGGGKGGSSGSQRVPQEESDTLRSRAYANVLDLLCEGEIQGLVDGMKSVYLDETPIQNSNGTYNFTGVEVTSRMGTQAQAYIPGFPASEAETAVGIKVTKASPVTRTITNANVNAVRVRVSVPALTYQNPSNGDLGGTSVTYQIHIQTNSGGYVPQVFGSSSDITISGKTTSKYERTHRVSLSGSGPWDIRVVRITDDSTSATLNNETWWESYTEIVDSKLRYPNSALVGIRIDSSQFQRIPTRGYDCRLLKVLVPTNATVRADGSLSYSGTWDGTFQLAWSSDPAWCFYDLITNDRYGCGQFVDTAQVDKWALYTISQYCSALVPNGFGGTEPRFSCNLYLQSREEAFKVLQDMASIFRGMLTWSAGAITAVQDAPADPVMLYSPANVVDGLFTYQGSSLKQRHTVAIVSWNDPDDMCRSKQEYVEDAAAVAQYGVISTEVVAVGCTSRGQAHRVGEWLLYSEQNETETVQFRTGLDSALVRPGDIIRIADPVRAGQRFGGRISSATTTAVTVDDAPTATLPATLHVLLANGTVESRSVQSINNNTRVITVTSAFTAAPAAQSVWVLESATIASQLFRVLSVVEAEAAQYDVIALAHNPSKYAYIERDQALQTRDITDLNAIPAAPTRLVLSESLYTYQSEVRAKVTASWLAPDGVNQFLLRWKKDGGNWQEVRTQNPDHDILNITPGSFTVRVYSVNAAGRSSTSYAESSITALGKTAPPADVPALYATLDPDTGVVLNWDPVTDLDLQGYEIRVGSSWASSTLVATRLSATRHTIGLVDAGTTTWWIKALDTSGNYSTTATSTSITVSAPPSVNLTGSFSGSNVILDWDDVRGSLSTQHYELRYGATWAGATVIGNVQASTWQTRVTWSGLRTFWVAAVDLRGNYGTPSSFGATITPPAAPSSLTTEVIDNNVLLRWSAATATLPVDTYELRRGATFSGATVIGTKSGLFTSVFETTSGSYTYWIVGIDSAGNYGTEKSVTCTVAEPPDYILRANVNSTWSGTRSNVLLPGDGTAIACVNTTETWEQHFTTRSWTNIQDAINAGYTIYLQPSQTSGSYSETIDYGTTLAACRITASLGTTTISGSTTITPTISTSPNNSTWTDYTGQSQAYGTNFRYAKVSYAISSSGGDDLVRLNSLNIRLDSKLRTDAGTVDAVAGDSGGTTVTFNVSFIDVTSITLTPLSTTPLTAVYDFTDAPNPTSFKVLVFNSSGTRVSVPVSWSVRGI